jgi:hypothetical protein
MRGTIQETLAVIEDSVYLIRNLTKAKSKAICLVLNTFIFYQFYTYKKNVLYDHNGENAHRDESYNTYD